MANAPLPTSYSDATPDPTTHPSAHNRVNAVVNDHETRIASNVSTLSNHENRITKLENLTPGATPGGGAGTPGAPGAAGSTSTTGSTGPAGTNGNTVRNGTGSPADTVGNDGDFYLDTASAGYTLYGPKASGTWTGAPTKDLRGPAGANAPGATTTTTGTAYTVARAPFPVPASGYSTFTRGSNLPLKLDYQNLFGRGADAIVGAASSANNLLNYYNVNSGKNGSLPALPGTYCYGLSLDGDFPVAITGGNGTPDVVAYEQLTPGQWTAAQYAAKPTQAKAVGDSNNGNAGVNNVAASGAGGLHFHLMDCRPATPPGSTDFRLAYRASQDGVYTLGVFGLAATLPYAASDNGTSGAAYSASLIGCKGGYVWAVVRYNQVNNHASGFNLVTKRADTTSAWQSVATQDTVPDPSSTACHIAEDGSLWMMKPSSNATNTQVFYQVQPTGGVSNPFAAANPFPTGAATDAANGGIQNFQLIPAAAGAANAVAYVVAVGATTQASVSPKSRLVWYALNPVTQAVVTFEGTGYDDTSGLNTYKVVRGPKGADGKTAMLTTFYSFSGQPTANDNDHLDALFVS